jgi:hypothetical protein
MKGVFQGRFVKSRLKPIKDDAGKTSDKPVLEVLVPDSEGKSELLEMNMLEEFPLPKGLSEFQPVFFVAEPRFWEIGNRSGLSMGKCRVFLTLAEAINTAMPGALSSPAAVQK